MKCDREILTLYAVTDRSWTFRMPLIRQVEEAILGGVTCVQLREKDLPDEQFLAEAWEIKTLCKRYGIPFIVNDSADIALKCKADGIHTGQCDMSAKDVRSLVGKDMIFGVSVNTLDEAVQAVSDGADYLGVGAVFTTSTKADADEVSLETLSDICAAVTVPVVAIGGISSDNIMQLKGSGIAGVAVVSAIFGSDDPRKAAQELSGLSKLL